MKAHEKNPTYCAACGKRLPEAKNLRRKSRFGRRLRNCLKCAKAPAA